MVQFIEELSAENVPDDFRRYVDEVLLKEWMGAEVEERLWGKTPFGQHFVLVTSKVVWYAVRVIVDEEHRDLEIVRQRNVYSEGVVSKNEFLTLEAAMSFRANKHAELSDGIFTDNEIAYRIRKLPADCIELPDKYLKPGDHIQRRLDMSLPFGNHEGVYIGNCKIAHINRESETADVQSIIGDKQEAHARIDKMDSFVTYRDQEIRVIVHCFRRRSREDIVETAKRLAIEGHRHGEYHLLRQNCQHFAAYCVINLEYMSDKEELIQKGIIGATLVVAFGSAVYSFFHRNDEEEKRQTIRR
uniref:LRAT domain-containing protein n=1 Tax=Panagrolaimus sp. JU765 TaxID=591449 RepID=A0AC34QXE2_9BILA